MWSELVLFVLLTVSGTEGQGNTRLVLLDQGPVRGVQESSTGIYVFSSIPYATAPSGSQRFQAPLSPRKWVEPLEGDKKIVCPQVDNDYVKNKVMQDDCLIVNVFVPDTNGGNLSVVVYIHGGAFQMGQGNQLPPNNFIKNRNIIAVTFNYRLGINGFLCLGTKGASGNAGLKDQVALLKWVKKNIASFGGNPDDVTLSGCSAGSVSIELLMLSKAAQGLFNKVIPESGSSTGIIAMQIDPVKLAENYARSLGYKKLGDVYALEKFLKSVPVTELFKGTINFSNKNSTFDFVPCVERETGDEIFIKDTPISIIKNGDYRKVPMLYGFTNMEGLFQIDRFPTWKLELNQKFSDFLPVDLKFDGEEEREEVASIVRKYYFGDTEISENNVLQFVSYMTDVLFVYPMLRSLKLLAESGHDQIYLYEYSFVDEDTPVVPYTSVRGANHCGQKTMVLDVRRVRDPRDVNVTKLYKKIQADVQNMWYNFIVTGKPVPKGSSLPAWPPAQSDRSPHMSLGRTMQLKGRLLEQRSLFWDDIYSRYYRAPQAPPPALSPNLQFFMNDSHDEIRYHNQTMIPYIF